MSEIAESMLERVARAICASESVDPDVVGSEGEPFWKAFVVTARAAIEAMMEPTEEMLNAVPASHSTSFQAIWPQICGDIYRSMLASAIRSPTPLSSNGEKGV